MSSITESFFFSSRRLHTRCLSDWSSDVCSSDLEWLVDCVGARLSLVTAYKHVGHSVQRLQAPTSRRGQDLVDDLLAGVARRAIPLAVGNAVDQLIGGGHSVLGARLKAASGATSRV